MTSRTLAQAMGLVLTGMFTVAGVAHAAEPSKTTPPKAVVAQGVQVAIDPATGKLREPTAAERAAYSRAFQARQTRVSAFAGQPLTASDAASTKRKMTFRSGATATGMRVPQSLMSSVVATRAADGTLSIHHDDGAAAPKAPEATR